MRKHRKARFLTQEALAERADLTPKMVSLIERFQRNPTVNVADSIAQAMEVPLWRLIKDAEDLRKEKALSKSKR
jgi:transcriptional regulator with XRE-family HTH domain